MSIYKKVSLIAFVIIIGLVLLIAVVSRKYITGSKNKELVAELVAEHNNATRLQWNSYKTLGRSFVKTYEQFLDTDLPELEKLLEILHHIEEKGVPLPGLAYGETLQTLIKVSREAHELPELRNLPFRTGGDLLNLINKIYVDTGIIPNNRKLLEINKIAVFLYLLTSEFDSIGKVFFAEGFFRAFDKNMLSGISVVEIISSDSFAKTRRIVNLINPSIYSEFCFLDLTTADLQLRYLYTPYRYSLLSPKEGSLFASIVNIYLSDHQGNVYNIVPALKNLYLFENGKKRKFAYEKIETIVFRGLNDKELLALLSMISERDLYHLP